MGAYYTWLNQQRLPGAEKATFLVWFEDQQEAVAIGPGFERGKTLGRSDRIARSGLPACVTGAHSYFAGWDREGRVLICR